MAAHMHVLLSGFLALCITGFSPQAYAQDGARRIVSVGGDVTEIVYALGHGDEVVATDSTSVYPSQALQTPKVGYVRQLAAESVLSLSPTLILLGGAAGPEAVIEQLRSTGLDIVEIDIEYSVDAVRRKVRQVAEALDEGEEGETLVAQIDRDWQTAQAEIALIEGAPRALFFASMGDEGPRAAGEDTAAHAVLEMLGVENAFENQQGYRALSVEAALVADPDVIFVMSHNVRSLGGVEAVAANPVLALTDAGRNGRIIAVDSVRVMSFGPRFAEGLAQTARDLNAVLQAEPMQ